jgi:perosamine synthetase
MQMKENKFISSAGPSITELEINYVTDAIKNGWGNNMNGYIDRFTSKFSEYVDLPYCLPTSHCTDAIHLALIAAGIKEGDEVIVPDLTWVASAAPILYLNATPVFADVDPQTWCINPDSIQENITSKTKAVIAVDLLGNMPDMDPIINLCNQNDLILIEDAAEGIGASYKNKLAGQFGHISVFSLNATKLIMSGQGGVLCTSDEKLFEKAKLFSHHGIDQNIEGKYFWSYELGYQYKWTNIQAALALAQLERIHELIEFKTKLYDKFQEELSSIDGLSLNDSPDIIQQSYWITCAIHEKIGELSKESVIKEFNESGIAIRPMFYPISAMPPYKKFANKDVSSINKVSYDISRNGICLPSGNDLNLEEDVPRIASKLKNILS